MTMPYALGMPVWALPDWRGRLFSKRAKPTDFLAQYSQGFNTVEGNTTFYQVPSAQTVERWRKVTAPGFRFAFKFPKDITHTHALRGAALDEAREFLQVMHPLRARIGPFLLQLPPYFAPSQLGDLDHFLRALNGPPLAVEVRHPGFYGGWADAALNEVLARHGADRALMDTRPLRAAPSDDGHSLQALSRKPDLPVEPVRIGDQPFVRIVTHLDQAVTRPFLQQWAAVIARWIGEGCHPWIFVHSPGDVYAPEVARTLHGMIRALRPEIAPLPEWAGEGEPAQLGLF